MSDAALWDSYNDHSRTPSKSVTVDTPGRTRCRTRQARDQDLSRHVTEANTKSGPAVREHDEAAPPSVVYTKGSTMSVYQPIAADNPSSLEPVKYALAAIPTTYRGCRFRSRLEAKWAVFFDYLDIGWQYEPQGYTIGDRAYLPDFLLECGTWVEVKGHEDALDYSLMRTAAIALPQMPATDERGPKLLILGAVPIQYDVPIPGDYGWLGLDPDGRGDELLFHTYGFGRWDRHTRPWVLGERSGDGPWLRPVFEEWETDTTDAYAAASGARFEHGESGAA